MNHTPVLLKEVIRFLDPAPGSFQIDGTVNGGGHAGELVKRVGSGGRLLAVDRDPRLLSAFMSSPAGRQANVIGVAGSYADIPAILKKKKLPKADGLLLDLGFSSAQLEAGRGFSFKAEHALDPLDMRYAETGVTAAAVVNSMPREELERIFREFGEERYTRRIAEAIVVSRRKKKIITVGDIVAILKALVPGNYDAGRLNPATRVFQALRIYVNHELDELTKVLGELEQIIVPGGRICVISFHSLEDRLVKRRFRELSRVGCLTLLTKKPITSSLEEAKENPRSRSAKLRAAVVRQSRPSSAKGQYNC